MSRDILDDILRLLVATIFADKRIFASEIDAFLSSAIILPAISQSKRNFSEAKLLAWYEIHKDTIRDKITTPYFKDWFYELLDKLSHLEDKKSILRAMKDISIADGEVHVSERALITLAARYWSVELEF